MWRENKDLVVAGFFIIMLIFLGMIEVHCQKKEDPLHVTQHTGQIEQEDEIRIMTVTVTEKNGDLVYLYRDTGKLIEVTYLFWDKYSVIKTDEAKPPYTFKGCFLMAYCLKHKYIYWLQRTNCTKELRPFFFSDKGG